MKTNEQMIQNAETEPLPPVFDEIMSNRVSFTRELAL